MDQKYAINAKKYWIKVFFQQHVIQHVLACCQPVPTQKYTNIGGVVGCVGVGVWVWGLGGGGDEVIEW